MPHQRVVVGVDGSPLSMAAVTRAAQVASAHGYSLVVLHAFAADLPMLGFAQLTDGSAVVSTHAQRLVADGVARAHAVDPDLHVTTAIRDGYASQAIVEASSAAALVVIGAMSHGVLGRGSVGAVAMQVVTHARCPVLVVGGESGGSPASGRVVVGVDGSKPSLRALTVAFDEALRGGGTLDVLHAWEAHSATDPTLSTSSSWTTYEANLQQIVEAGIAPHRTAHPDLKVDYEVVRSAPVGALIDRSEGAALLVVGSRGSGGFPGLHVGSTAMGLIGRTHCPLLLTR